MLSGGPEKQFQSSKSELEASTTLHNEPLGGNMNPHFRSRGSFVRWIFFFIRVLFFLVQSLRFPPFEDTLCLCFQD